MLYSGFEKKKRKERKKQKREKTSTPNPLKQLYLEVFPHLVMVVQFAVYMSIHVTVCAEHRTDKIMS